MPELIENEVMPRRQTFNSSMLTMRQWENSLLSINILNHTTPMEDYRWPLLSTFIR